MILLTPHEINGILVNAGDAVVGGARAAVVVVRRGRRSWGARDEGIQILRWGNPDESLRLLQAHQGYRHIRRMVLELEGQEAAAASLE